MGNFDPTNYIFVDNFFGVNLVMLMFSVAEFISFYWFLAQKPFLGRLLIRLQGVLLETDWSPGSK